MIIEDDNTDEEIEPIEQSKGKGKLRASEETATDDHSYVEEKGKEADKGEIARPRRQSIEVEILVDAEEFQQMGESIKDKEKEEPRKRAAKQKQLRIWRSKTTKRSKDAITVSLLLLVLLMWPF